MTYYLTLSAFWEVRWLMKIIPPISNSFEATTVGKSLRSLLQLSRPDIISAGTKRAAVRIGRNMETVENRLMRTEEVSAHQFSSVAQSCLTLCNPINHSMPGLPVHHQLLDSTQTHVHWVGDAIQLSHPLLSPSLPALNLSQYQGLFKWVFSSHQVAKILEFQLQHQSFQWILRTDFP